jgi:ADP-heptose:LPS heptosyltransferase
MTVTDRTWPLTGDRVPGVRKIAVLRANALGDFLFTLPALESLKAAYPEAELVLIGAVWHAQELAGRPGPVDRVLVAPAVPGLREPVPGEQPPSDFFARAQAERFDLALQLHGGGRQSNPVVGALGARVTAGLRAPDAPPLDRVVPYVYYQPEVFRYLEVVSLVGTRPVTYRPRFLLTAADREEALRAAGPAAGPRVAVHPGANDPRRRWPAERFGEVADALVEAGAEVVVTGSADELELVNAVAAAARHPVRSLAGGLSLGGLAGLYADCALMVANDTGPLHLAEAVGTATVGLYRASNMINCAPVDRTVFRPIVSWIQRCPVCGADSAAEIHPDRTAAECAHRVSFVTDIPVVEVVRDALDLLAAGAEPSHEPVSGTRRPRTAAPCAPATKRA